MKHCRPNYAFENCYGQSTDNGSQETEDDVRTKLRRLAAGRLVGLGPEELGAIVDQAGAELDRLEGQAQNLYRNLVDPARRDYGRILDRVVVAKGRLEPDWSQD